MLESLYLTARGLSRVHTCWLRKHIDDYFCHLTALRFKTSTLRIYANQLLAFAAFVERRGCRRIDELPQWASQFLDQLQMPEYRLVIWRSTLTRFLDHWRRQGVIPRLETETATGPNEDVLADYLTFMAEHRGVSRERLKGVDRCCRAMLADLDAQGTNDLSQLKAEWVHRFLVQQGSRYKRTTMSNVSTMIPASRHMSCDTPPPCTSCNPVSK